MAGNLNNDLLLNTLGNFGSKPVLHGDVNQNFVDQTKLYQAGLRGLNNNKPSPDSGWTFPGLVAPQLFPGILSQQGRTASLVNGSSNKLLPDFNTLTAEFRAPSNNVNRASTVYPNMLPEAYQTKVLNPLMEMNLRHQQQQHMLETAMLSQSNNAYNFMSVKGYDHSNAFAATQNNVSFNSVGSTANTNMISMNVRQGPNSTEQFGKAIINNNERKLWTDRKSSGSLTPAVTPVEGKHMQDSLMQPYIGMDNSQIQNALAATQMHNYLSLLRQTQLSVRQNEKQDVANVNGALNLGLNLQNLPPTPGNFPSNAVLTPGCNPNTVVLTPGSNPNSVFTPGYISNTVLTPILTPGAPPNGLTPVSLPMKEPGDSSNVAEVAKRQNPEKLHSLQSQYSKPVANGGSHKHADVVRSQADAPHHGFDASQYQASSNTSLAPPASKRDISPVDYSRPMKTSPHPQRPNHLGSGFIPQTQFLTVNVNHGTPGSDKESIHSSSISPNHASPYSLSGQRSRTPSPHSDKAKGKNDNTCSQCGKQFSSSSALAKHKLIHSDERKYVCQICSRGFKRQDHLNGHMITHRDKKPYECHFTDCAKSYCDMRSLRRHVENHHGSPPGGATPAGYMPKLMSLYPGYSEENMKAHIYRTAQTHEQDANRLAIPNEIPRPSSAPLVPPEPKRVTRTRRSSSGEESSMQLDPAMAQELEMRRAYAYTRHKHGSSDEYTNKPKEEQIESSRSVSSTQMRPLKSIPVSSLAATEYNQRMEYSRQMYERHEHERQLKESNQAEFERHHPHHEIKQSHTAERLYKDYEKSVKKPEFSPPGVPHPAYPAGMPSHMMNSRFPWGTQYSQPGPSPSSANMPFLLNIRNPFSFPQIYQSQKDIPTSEATKISKSEHEARQQAMNTYYQMWANGQHGGLPEPLMMHHSRMLPGQNHPTPTDPAAIAIAAAKEPNDKPSFKTRDALYGIHPTNAKWQPVMQDDSVTREKEPKPNYYSHPVSTSHESNYVKRPTSHESLHTYPPQERNIIDEPFKPSESNHREHYRYTHSPKSHYYDRNRPIEQHLHPQNRAVTYNVPNERFDQKHPFDQQRHLNISPNRFDPRTPQREHPSKMFETPLLRVETQETSMPSIISPNKKRPRPGPIIIPPAVNSRTMPNSTSPLKNFPRGIYTPPAMLSPKSIFFNPPGLTPRPTAVPTTPARLLLIRRNSSVDQREAPLPATVSASSEEQASTEVVVPEPKINVGPQFQAFLPNLVDISEAHKDIHRASLMWSPLKEDEQKYVEVNAYLDMACSLGLYGGSNNKEYALHILQRTRGNVKEAVRLLLSRRHILRADDPNADYHYSGSVRWTAKERLAFRQAYRTKGKVFNDIQKEVITKSVQLCVEFYYQWKAMHPESFRARTRMVEVESEQDDEEVPPTPTAAVAPLSTLREPVFECDYPECRARFVSRQALNGHIRVHGGSFSKPLDNRRSKPKSLISPELEGISMASPAKKKRPTVPSSVIVTNTSDGPQLQFQCKVCGRVFSKVKSRSAHMKTHVKRDDNNKPIKKQKPSKQKPSQSAPQPVPPINPMTVFAHA